MPDLLTLNYTPAAARFLSRMQGYAARVHLQGDKALQTQMQVVRQQIVATSPVDTGRLRGSWSPPRQDGDLGWSVSTDLDYAPPLQYGGYRRVGRSGKTIRLGGGPLGAGFVAGPGVYSRQAPLGFVRRALADASEPLLLRLRNVLREGWGRGGTGPGFGATGWVGTGAATRRMELTAGQLGSLFGVSIVTRTSDL